MTVNASPLISVVMTTCNGERYIDQQIRSVLSQTYTNLELIISDDGSTDATWQQLQAYCGDGRVRVLKNAQQPGIHTNLENALRLANGAYIAVCDQDDVWEPDKLERQQSAIGKASAIYSDSLLIDAYGASLGESILQRLNCQEPDIGHRVARLLLSNCVSGHALMFDAGLLDVALPFADQPMYDHQLAMLAAACGGLAFVDAPLVHHRIHADNSNNDFRQQAVSMDRPARNRRALSNLRENLEFLCRRAGLLDNKNVAPTVEALAPLHEYLSKGEPSPGLDWRLLRTLWPLRREIFHLTRPGRINRRLLRFCRF